MEVKKKKKKWVTPRLSTVVVASAPLFLACSGTKIDCDLEGFPGCGCKDIPDASQCESACGL